MIPDDMVQTELDRYMPSRIGEIVHPWDIMKYCDDLPQADQELRRWQSRNNSVSDIVDTNDGAWGVKVYGSIVSSRELEFRREQRRKYIIRVKRRERR